MRTERLLRRLLEWIVVLLMAALCGVVLLGVGFRKAGAPLVWYDETASILLAWLTFYGAALAALMKAHIGFPDLVRRCPPRLRLILVIFRELMVLGFWALVAWAGWQVLMVLGRGTMISLPWVPAQLTHSVIPLGALLCLLAELAQIRERLREALAAEGRPT